MPSIPYRNVVLWRVSLLPRLMEAAGAVGDVDPAPPPAAPEFLPQQRDRLPHKRGEPRVGGLPQVSEIPFAQAHDPPAAPADLLLLPEGPELDVHR